MIHYWGVHLFMLIWNLLVLCASVQVRLCCEDTFPHPPTQKSREIYVAIGSSVELPCGAGMTKGVEWRLKGSVLFSGPVLHLHNTSLEDQGVYTCYGPHEELIEMLHVQMGYAPLPPEVQCWSPSYPLKALCSWTQTPDPILPTYYIATYWYPEKEQFVVHSCQRERDQDKQCTLEELELNSQMHLIINITAVNALGSATRILRVLIEDIVKPDPPVNVKLTSLPNRKVRVQWSPPPSWLDPVNFALKYKVQFQWDKLNITSIMGPYESDSMVRSGLVPGRTYHIRVSAVDFLGLGQSSEWSDPVNITLPAN